MSDFGYFNGKNVLSAELLTVSTGNQVLTPATYNAQSAGATSQREYPTPSGQKAKGAVVEAHGAIYYTFDGSTPTSTNGGHLAADGVMVVVGLAKLAALKMVRGGGSDVTVYVTYYV